MIKFLLAKRVLLLNELTGKAELIDPCGGKATQASFPGRRSTHAEEITMEFTTVHNGDITLNVAVKGAGPLILCVHGWPELWCSWRSQIDYFSSCGYKVAAMDVRGYGGSSRPWEIAAYSMQNLAGDVAAVIDQLGGGSAILFGHDWGAPIVWNTALLHASKVAAVAGLSVPYVPRGPVSALELMEKAYAGRFFYQLYFQREGVAEAELEADIPDAIRKIFFACSGDAPLDSWLAEKPPTAGLLDGMIDPDPAPKWMSDGELDLYIDAFRTGGFRGPLNRYRAQKIDFVELSDYERRPITQPSYFIGGERDPVRHFVPGRDLYENPGAACLDFRGSCIVPRVGHWLQQEAPDSTNAALADFLEQL
jgi:pimeloyl-ACP methyl ester carboxylesterase